MVDSPETRQTLIVKLRTASDQTAWDEFVKLYDPLIYRLARRKGLQDADARDLVQDVFRAVSRSIERWDPDRGRFRAWLSGITRNLLLNFLTRGKEPRGSGSTSVQALLEASPALDPSATALLNREFQRQAFLWAARQVREAVEPRTWQAFYRTAVRGAPASLVATELGLSVGAVYVARSRVLARLQERVDSLSRLEAAGLEEPDA